MERDDSPTDHFQQQHGSDTADDTDGDEDSSKKAKVPRLRIRLTRNRID